MQAVLFANLTSLTLSTSETGGAFSFPKIVAGADLTIGLRPVEVIGGTPTEVQRTLTALKVSLGKADARPIYGSYKLHLGSATAEAGVNVTAAISYGATAAELAAAINALSGVADLRDCAVTSEGGVYRIAFADATAEYDVAVLENSLRPVSFVEVNAVEANDGSWVHEIKLTQTPVAQTVDFATVATEVPSIEQVRAGGADGDIEWSELQKLIVPADFRGTFDLRRGYRKTQAIGLPTSADDIQSALDALVEDGEEFIVTEIQDGVLIEFAGDMAGINQPLLTVGIIEQHPGDPTFTLRTATAEMWSLLSTVGTTGELKLPLEVKVWLQDEEEDEEDKLYIFRPEITITLPVDVEDRNAASLINWNQPRGRRAVLPFTPGQVLVGNRSYPETIGDGVATSFEINHDLDTAALQISVRENVEDGRLLSCPLDYNIEFGSNNALTITPQPEVAGVLSADAWLVVITMADEAVYQAHEHAIGEVTGLQDLLDAFGAAINSLQDLVPTGALTERTVASGTPVFEVQLPRFVEVYPSRETLEVGADQTIADLPAASLPRDGGLVPAVHAAAATDLESGTELPAITTGEEGNANTVLKNATGAAIQIPGGRGRRSVQLQPNEYAANDGTRWYRVSRIAEGENTWYPTDFDRVLFEVAINSKVLIAKRTLEVDLGFRVALRSLRQAQPARWAWDTLKNTKAQWELVIEHGSKTSESNPATTGTNIKGIVWDATPILAHPILLTTEVTTHQFGARIARAANGDLSASAIYYGAAESSASVPASADFLLRARLRRFDIQDGISDPSGLILLQGLDQALGDAGDTTLGRLIIR